MIAAALVAAEARVQSLVRELPYVDGHTHTHTHGGREKGWRIRHNIRPQKLKTREFLLWLSG